MKNIPVASRNERKKNQPRQMPPVSSWIHPRKLFTRTISIVLLKFSRLFVFSAQINVTQKTIFTSSFSAEVNGRVKCARLKVLVNSSTCFSSFLLTENIFTFWERRKKMRREESKNYRRKIHVRAKLWRWKQKVCCVDHVFHLHTWQTHSSEDFWNSRRLAVDR